MQNKLLRARINLGKDEQNTTIYKWISAKTADELVAKKQEIQNTVSKTKKQNKILTLKDYADNWYTLFKAPNVKLSTQTMYLNVLNNHIYKTLGNLDIKAITPNVIQKFILQYSNSSTSQIKKINLTLNQIFTSAQLDGIIAINPMARIKAPKGTKSTKEAIPMNLISTITDKLIDNKDGALPLLLLYTGIRRGEALAIEWSDILNNMLTINKALTFKGNKPVINTPKTSSAFRTIPLNATVINKLGKPKGKYVFGGDTPYTESKFDRMFERIKRSIPELKPYTAHSFRHTYATMLHKANVDAATAQYLLGHSDYSTTANIYTKIDNADITKAFGQLKNLTVSLNNIIKIN